MKSLMIVGNVAVAAALSVILLACSSASGIKTEPQGTASSSEPVSDFTRIQELVDSAGWQSTREFDWASVGRPDSELPEVAEAAPGMATWIENSIFSTAVNGAKSTSKMIDDLEQRVGTTEYSRMAAEYRDDPSEGLTNAAAYGLVISPDVRLAADPGLQYPPRSRKVTVETRRQS